MIQSEIIAFSTSTLDIRQPIFILMRIYADDHGHAEIGKPHSAHAQALK